MYHGTHQTKAVVCLLLKKRKNSKPVPAVHTGRESYVNKLGYGDVSVQKCRDGQSRHGLTSV